MTQNHSSAVRLAASPGNNRGAMAGVLTKTIIQSPVVHWILHARIRQRGCNDVVFVGNDFIHVKQVKEHGHLHHIATKNDFDARIRAAKTFSNEVEAPDEDLFIKVENEETSMDSLSFPPQSLVLTLDSNDLLFLYLAGDGAGGYRFVHQALPMPTFDRMLFQPGQHLAIDPQSRALAVAANEREIVIYSSKEKERIKRELETGYSDWCPVSCQRPMQVEGVIQHMDFLIPPTDDQGFDDEDHVILVLIVVDNKKTRAVWIDWYYSSDLHHAQHHPGQALDASGNVPSLLIPLRNASFLLTYGSEIKRWKDILSGSATSSSLHPLVVEPSSPGASPRRPVWANWCRPRRPHGVDHLYLFREDGKVYFIQTTADRIEASHAGDFGCHIGTGCASLGDSRDPDILAVAGDMSSGCIQSIGSWFTPFKLQEFTSRDAMEMEWIETISNWASATDMVVSSLPGKSQRSRDGVFVTSCRQPYGAITELRHGLEARLSVYFELEGLKSVKDVWALPFTASGHILVVLSSPAGTRLLDIPADGEIESIDELEDASLGLDSAHRTLATAATLDGKIIQITERSICITSGTFVNFEDCASVEYTDGSAILAAVIDTRQSHAFIAERSEGANAGYTLACLALRTDDPTASGQAQIVRIGACDLESEPLCLSVVPQSGQTLAIIASVDSQISAFAIEEHGSIRKLADREISFSPDSLSMCDSIAILQPKRSLDQPNARSLALCGLRDGSIYVVALNPSDPNVFCEESIRPFSQSTVKLIQPPDDSSIAYAMSGPDICLVSWDGRNISSLNTQNAWISDKLNPELSQGSVVAATHMPAAHLLSSPDLADSLVMISGDEFLVTSLERAPGAVPRQIPVSGTPNRLIYSERQRCIVSSSICYGVRSFPSSHPHSKPEERRQTWPVIDFIPSRNTAPPFSYEMQPGERIYSLLEWSFKLSEDKTYSFILAGGSYQKSSGAERGRITFLQPINKNWTIESVKEGRCINFDLPVYAMALFSENTIIACVGYNIRVIRFSEENRKWEHVCAPFKLATVGIHVSVSFWNIFVSTMQDSLVCLSLIESSSTDAATSHYNMELVVQSMAPRAETLLSHLVPSTKDTKESLMNNDIALMSTKYGQLIGLQTKVGEKQRHANSADLIFEAHLPRSLIKLRQCNIHPRWKPEPPIGVIVDNVIGCSADGTLTGIALLDEHLWRRLSWLQRLCEWSEELSAHSYKEPVYSVSDGTYAREERLMPIGLSANRRDEIVMRTGRTKLGDGHIDGDVLSRMLKKGDTEVLRWAVSEVAEKDDRAGVWMRAHLEEELGAVDETVELVKRLLDCWM